MALTLIKLPVEKLFCAYKEECTVENVDECADTFVTWNWIKVGIELMAFTAVICTVLYEKKVPIVVVDTANHVEKVF